MISYLSNYNNFKTQVVQKFGCLGGAFCPIRNEEFSGLVCGMHKDLNLVFQKGFFTHLLQVELVGEHPLAVVALCRLPRLPVRASVRETRFCGSQRSTSMFSAGARSWVHDASADRATEPEPELSNFGRCWRPTRQPWLQQK